MKSAIFTPAIAALLFGAAASAKRSYDGYRVFRVEYDSFKKNPHTTSKMALTTWNDPEEWEKEGHVDVVVEPKDVEAFKAIGMDATVMHHNLGATMAEEADYASYQGAVDDSWFQSYHSYEDHVQYVEDLQAQYPTRSEVVSSGTSVEGRNITGIHFWGSKGKGKSPSIVLHGTVHAREWITTMTTEFIAYSLLKNYTSNAAIKAYVDKYDFHIFPVVNPDGFVFSQTDERLWRKNRLEIQGNSCVGTDINRNWPTAWEVPGGSSTNPCDETYRGTAPASAPETKGLSAYLQKLSNASGLQMYSDVHSYSQLFMTPYGYSCSKRVANNAEYQSLAAGAARSIKALFGTQYTTGPICPTIYQTSGNSVDWATDVAKATFAFAVELRDTGRYGFVLPPRFITPTAQETFAGFDYVFKNM